ncbi:uncharacterized protein RHOBADRAFT_37661 [Rhodotorula graminis WP1]|uniref:Dethiobiotin synthase n=1 Tax=Rhodotorula graminis (strain WP1) TaxID=578459 RepID=A0A0P9H1G9_RHOGW|nr:uncharacterized protein RHOBADRAFT_37661 [Rhodotorula graminis WP1]KPV73800.1 hypothetical protein RHOBADRAFT_37661 [Rhodotorula graminis WP1]
MLSRHLRTHLVLAPSTSVGKSIFSTGLVRASLALGEKVGYLKPVGTGSGDGDDSCAHLQRFAPGARTACLFHFDEPVSPHLAVERAARGGGPVTMSVPTDDEFASAVGRHARDFALETAGQRSSLYIESAGGVHSPTLSGTSQLDAFRPLLPPTILVASAELGGISTTISAYESLLLRGYDVDAVLVFREAYYANHEYFERWFNERGIRVGVVDHPPQQVPSAEEDAANLEAYYAQIADTPLQRVVQRLQQIHIDRMSNLATAPRRTLDSVWWPFVQHGLVKNESDVMVIDSAHGDHFSVFSTSSPPPLLSPIFDGSASWWTQCLGHANPELTLAAAHAAGRFGHVMFPTATNLPALTLVEKLLASVGQGWASRVFYSDDGSTGMEVALKMALRAFADREQLLPAEGRKLAVLGLKGSYHGDTIGAMDACEGGVYSERVEWYEGRGHWLAAPEVRIEQGEVVVRGGADGGEVARYQSLTQLYDVDGRVQHDPLAQTYREQIERELEARIAKGDGIRFGALVLEPVVMGAGGMIFVDPLYQHVLVDLVRSNRTLFPATSRAGAPSTSPIDSTPVWQGLPVIFDEVFVGLHRLGRVTASTFLGSTTRPDIACYAKILTGGLVPMAVTLASDAIFQAFWGDKKVDALLHGHSYTAHAVGCGIANKTLDILTRMDRRGEWNDAKFDWIQHASNPGRQSLGPPPASPSPTELAWSFWSADFVRDVSAHPAVEGVMALGCVLAIHLRAADGSGYQSTASEAILRQLRFGTPHDDAIASSGASFQIHARPLGNVVYFMSSLNSKPATLRAVEASIKAALDVKAQ